MPLIVIILILVAGFAESTHADVLGSGSKTALRKSFEEAEADNWDEAEALATQSQSQLGRKILKWYRITRPGSDTPFDEASAFLSDNPDWPMQKTLQVRAEQALAADKSSGKAIAFYANRTPESGEGMLAYAAALAKKSPTKAAEYAHKGFPRADLPQEDMEFYQTQLASFLKAETYAKRVERLLCEERVAEASRYIGLITDKDEKLAAARIAVIQQNPRAAHLIAALGNAAKSPTLTFDRMKYREERGDERGVRQLAATLKSGGCSPALVWPYRRDAAQKFIATRSYRAAYQAVADHGLTEGEDFARAEFLAGWIATRFLKDHRTAYAHFYKLHHGVSYPVSLSRAAYWAAKAAKANGNGDIAVNWLKEAAKYPTTFFGQLALKELGDPLSLSESVKAKPTVQEEATFTAREAVKAARILIEIDRIDLAKLFIYEIQNQSKNPVTQKLATELGARYGRPELAVKAAKNALRNGFTLLGDGYPLIKEVCHGSAECAVTLAIIRQESEFDIMAVSKSGAVGLMQIMPKTAAHIAQKSGIDYQPGKLMTASYNTTLGEEYISELLNSFSGNLPLALAAYNAGPGRVREWLTTYGDPRSKSISLLDWVEMIPFEETRNYVMRVMENVEVYRWMLSQAEPTPSNTATASQ